MNKIYYLFMALLLVGCYKDKGNYKYDSLSEVEINIPFTTYEVGASMNLKIEPEVSSAIEESDLTWQWELAAISPVTNYPAFQKFAEGKTLDHIFNISGLITATGNYNVRLHAIQKSTNRSFYSPVFVIRVTSPFTGLMVLHGDDVNSDIALLKATDFRVSEGVTETSLIPNLYSSANSNQKIPGKGISIVQNVTEYLYEVSRTSIVAITNTDGVWARYADFTKGGDWNSMFMPGINKGKPQFNTPRGQYVYAIDDGAIFPRANNNYDVFPIPSPVSKSYYAGSPVFEIPGNYDVQGYFFDKLTRGFVAISGMYSFGEFRGDGVFQIPTSHLFNMADMNADLLYTDFGGRQGHTLAVMKENNGNKYLAQIDWSATTDNELPFAKYNMQVLPDIGSARFYAFGENQIAMCYYATASKVYRFTVNDGEALDNNYNELSFQNGNPISFDGEITMMKILKPLRNPSGSLAVDYYNYNKVLLVGVYKNNKGTLYSLKLDESTGEVISYTTFEGFNKIYDADIKGL